MNLLTAIGIVLILAGCTGVEPDASERVSATENAIDAEQYPGLSAAEKQAMETLLAACPGMSKYRQSWDLSNIREISSDSLHKIEWKMHDSIPSVPSQYSAIGHTCFAEIGGERPERVAVIKRPCVKVCLDRDADIPSSTLIEIQ